MNASGIRDARDRDFDAILALNAESVEFLSPLDEAKLRRLAAQAAYLRVNEQEREIAAFLLAFAPGATYESANYRWFANHFGGFLYIDRVVVSRKHQGEGLGNTMYEDLFAFARERGFQRVTCEFDIEPPNPVSASFHARYGFREVATQWVQDGKKRVSLQESLL